LLESRAKLPDGELIICRCEEITKQQVVDAINEGNTSVSGIRKRTRAGMGFCQGKSCSRQIRQLIVEYGSILEQQLEPARVRPPVRPIPVKTVIKGADEI